FDARRIMQEDTQQAQTLYFDAPLDENANPRNHFAHLKWLGEKLFAPYADFLSSSVNVFDSIAIVKDSDSHAPSLDTKIDSLLAASDWTGGLLGFLLNEGVRPRVLHSEVSSAELFAQPRLLVHIDSGLSNPKTIAMMKKALASGQGILNFVSDQSLRAAGANVADVVPEAQAGARKNLTFYLSPHGRLVNKHSKNAVAYEFPAQGPLYSYSIDQMPGCEGLLYQNDKVIGYRCQTERGVIMQIGALLFDDYNSSDYATLSSPLVRRTFLRGLLADFGVHPSIVVSAAAERVSVFARQSPRNDLLWITVKTSTQRQQEISLRVRPETMPGSLNTAGMYEVEDILSGARQVLSGQDLMAKGFTVVLAAEGSTVFVVRPQ
ncbi:MAG TPA: hypothetical protein VM432_01775, partial [Bdellovibrionales bacterium]|nr:hypothetical protein [Bdellovibrionales bacterium]